MHKLPETIQPLVELASRTETSADELLSAMSKVDATELKGNAFHILQAIPDAGVRGRGAINFTAVHQAIGTDSSVFATIADVCVRGQTTGEQMSDDEACEVLSYIFSRGLMKKVPWLLLNAYAYNKPKCAALLSPLKLTPDDQTLISWVNHMGDARAAQMANLLIDVALPEHPIFASLRRIAKVDSLLALTLNT